MAVIFDGMSFSGLDMSGVDLSYAWLDNCDLSKGFFEEVNFEMANMTCAVLRFQLLQQL